MTPETVINLVQNALYVLILVSAPPLAVSLLVGLLVSILQAATPDQRNDADLHPQVAGHVPGAGPGRTVDDDHAAGLHDPVVPEHSKRDRLAHVFHQ
ncbi:hypothetical protein QF022_003202 [Vogesella perlucida]|nr:hypothetical protein [Vogesella perlucida]